MNLLHRYKKGLNKKMFNEVDYTVLNYNQLLETNGAKGGSGGGGPSGPSSTSNSSNRGYPSSTEGYDSSTPSDITVNPRYTEQKYFSSIYGEQFGNNACAATSLLNELSEQYTLETGHALPSDVRDAAMAAAVNTGSVSSTNAWVSDWNGAANAMATAMGLEGSYKYKN